MTPPDERIVGDDDDDDFPLLEGSFPGRTAPPEPYIGFARFHLVAAVLRPENFLLIFSRAKDFI